MKRRRYSCPRCGKEVPIDTPRFPFCSDRCRLIDLGQWLNGEFSVAGERVNLPEPDDFEGGRE